MDFKKIFIKDACPTKIGGQAVMEGIMMKGEDRTALVIRLPDDKMHLTTEKVPKLSKWRNVPLIRGVLIFGDALVTGVRTLTKSAEILEAVGMEHSTATEASDADDSNDDSDDEEIGRFESWLIRKFGEDAPMRFMLAVAVIFALVLTILIFIILPTFLMGLFGNIIKSDIALNIIEGFMRILFFVVYVVCVSRLKEIQTVFRYHGAEHKCIHCYESGLLLTPRNCKRFETLHPRCGTSFMMFVMVIALLLFSLLGWPNLLIRITSRLVLIPVIAGLSFELLRFAGRSTSTFVKILSWPGLLLQKLTTMEPDEKQLEVAIAAMFAVLVSKETPVCEGICDNNGVLIPDDFRCMEGSPLIVGGYAAPWDCQ